MTQDKDERAAPDAWRVRIRSADPDSVIGSGVLLGGTTVLTCAHVLPGQHGRVWVDFPEIAGAASSPATVLDGCWFPPDQDRADLALLTLESPPPGSPSAPLVRAAPAAGLTVEMCGYPDSVRAGQGAAFRATLSRTFGERVQLNPAQPAHVPRHGFSGGPVLDMNQPTGVLGVTVTGYRDGTLVLAHMIPVDTIIKYLPGVDRWATGRQGVAPYIATRASASQRSADQPVDSGYAVRLATWLRGEDSAPGYVTEVARGGSRERTLRRALALADRELSAEAPVVLSSDPAQTVPPVGSLDLAVDATGLAADEVARQIAERSNLRESDPARARQRLRRLRLSLTVAILGVNRATDPDELLRLCEELAERGCRQLLVFDHEGTSLAAALRQRARERIRLRYRIGRITARLDDLTHRVSTLPLEPGPQVAALESEVAGLWEDLARCHCAAGARLPAQRLDAQLDRLTDRIQRVEELVGVQQRSAEQLRTLRSALRRDLHTYQLLAAHHQRIEDIELAPQYQEAYQALYGARFDPTAAAGAVARYTAAVRRVLGWPPATDEERARERDGADAGHGPTAGHGGDHRKDRRNEEEDR